MSNLQKAQRLAHEVQDLAESIDGDLNHQDEPDLYWASNSWVELERSVKELGDAISTAIEEFHQ